MLFHKGGAIKQRPQAKEGFVEGKPHCRQQEHSLGKWRVQTEQSP